MDSQLPPPRSLLRHAGFVRALARSLTRDAHSAEDLVQKTWLSALRRPPRHALNLRGWLGTVLRRTARRDVRVDARRAENEEAAARPEALPSSVEGVSHADTLQFVTEAVLSLREPYRQTLLERYYMGHSAAEIARRHGVPAATVRSRVKRALDELRERLDRRAGGREVWSTALLALGQGGLVMSTSTKIAAAVIVIAGLALIPILRDPAPQPERSDLVVARSAEELEPPELVEDVEPPEDEAPIAERAEVVSEPEPSAAEATPTGSLRIVAVYASDFAPAADLGIRLIPWNASTSVFDRDAIYGGPQVTTDEEGIAYVEDLPPGHFWVANSHGVVPEAPQIIAGEETELLIELTGLDLEGVVVDAEGTPVAGASVELATWGHVPLTAPKRVAVSDANGRFAVRAIPSLCSVGARASGHAPSKWYLVLGSEGNSLELTLALQGAGTRLRGTVRDPDGAPLPDASVLVGRLQMDLQTTTLPDGSKVIETRGQRVLTDEEGSFELDDCPPGEVPVAVRARDPELAPWFGTVELGEGTNELEVELERGVAVTGVAYEADGSPAARVEIEVKDEAPFGDRNLVTASDGSYRLAAVAPGEFEITAETDERGQTSATLTGEAGETLVWNPRLGRGVELAVRVLDENDQPLEFVFLHAFRPGSSGGEAWGHTDTEGRFTLANCPVDAQGGGLLTLNVDTPHNGQKWVENVDPLALAGDELVVYLPVAGDPVSVVGIVQLSDGTPAKGARVSIGGSYETVEADTGSLAIEGLLAGTHSLVIEVADYSRKRLGPRTLAPGETWDLGTVRIEKGGSILLRASELGQRAYFQVFDAEGRWYYNLHLDEGERQTRLAGVEPGSYSLAVSGTGVAVQWMPFEVASERETELDVELAAGIPGEISVTESVAVLLRLEREGVVLAHHWIHPRGDRPTLWTSAGFEPGSYVATIESADGRNGREEFLVTEGEEAVQVEIELR